MLALLCARGVDGASPIGSHRQSTSTGSTSTANVHTPDIVIAARSIRPGELVVMSVTVPATTDAVHVRAFDREVPSYRVARDRWQALIGIDLGVAPGSYPVRVDVAPSGGSLVHTLPVARRTFPTRTLNVDEAFVNPPPEMRARIDREAEDLRRIWSHPAAERLWTTGFVRPVPGEAVSRFGMRSVFNGQPRNPHSGADFLSPAGTPILAPNAGRVVLARDQYFSGNTVIIDHGQGLFSLLAHLSAFDVHEGDRVAAGDVVGRVGATGSNGTRRCSQPPGADRRRSGCGRSPSCGRFTKPRTERS